MVKPQQSQTVFTINFYFQTSMYLYYTDSELHLTSGKTIGKMFAIRRQEDKLMDIRLIKNMRKSRHTGSIGNGSMVWLAWRAAMAAAAVGSMQHKIAWEKSRKPPGGYRGGLQANTMFPGAPTSFFLFMIPCKIARVVRVSHTDTGLDVFICRLTLSRRFIYLA